MNKIRRRPFSTNPFERKILGIVLASTCIPVIMVMLFFYVLFYEIIYVYLRSGLADHFIKSFLSVAAIITLLYIVVVGVIAYRFVHGLFGSYPRVAGELEDIINGKAKKHIHLRLGDYGKELVNYVNALIDRLP